VAVGALWAPARADLIPVTQECLTEAARIFGVPYDLALAVLATEGGQVGRINRAKSGTYDVGPMQINSTWLPILREIGLKAEDIRDNGCANVAVGIWILRLNYLETGDLTKALAYYHSRDPQRGRAYVKAAQEKRRNPNPLKTLRKANAPTLEAGRK
jgi:soluble lytic murein transglycosylase-like protein